MRKLLILAMILVPCLCWAEIDQLTIQLSNIPTNAVEVTNDTALAVDGEIYSITYQFTGTNLYTNAVILSTIGDTNNPALTILTNNLSTNAWFYPEVRGNAIPGGGAGSLYKPLVVVKQKIRARATNAENAQTITNSHLRISINYWRK